MHIGLDGLPLTQPKTGVGHYTFELAVALAEFSPADDFEVVYPSTFPALKNAGSLPAPIPENLSFKRVKVGLLGRRWWSTGLPRYVRRRGLDLFHGTNYDIPLWRKCATVLTVHDLSQLLYPETHTKRSVARARRRLQLMARSANAIITPTQTVKREVCENLKIEPERVFAVHEAARRSFTPESPQETKTVRQRLGIGDDFLLSVGTLEPRKNLIVLIEAFEAVAGEDGGDLQLVLAGGKGWLSTPLLARIKNSPARARIILTDYLDD